ncbi:hypothetical protein HY256_11940 [Candidatus Sumerlaeota bacterium]|nr:hypothetical protein [Candidatus Sumerlaeota bacterium]
MAKTAQAKQVPDRIEAIRLRLRAETELISAEEAESVRADLPKPRIEPRKMARITLVVLLIAIIAGTGVMMANTYYTMTAARRLPHAPASAMGAGKGAKPRSKPASQVFAELLKKAQDDARRKSKGTKSAAKRDPAPASESTSAGPLAKAFMKLREKSAGNATQQSSHEAK